MKVFYYVFKNRMVSILIARTIYKISPLIAIFLLPLFTDIAIARPKYTIIPQPQELQWTDSKFTVNSDSVIVIGDNPKEKDLVASLCDWHYASRKSYPSLNYFQKRVFQVIAVPWYKKENIFYFAKEAIRVDALGGLSTNLLHIFEDLKRIDLFPQKKVLG